jgi:hypothetical protein
MRCASFSLHSHSQRRKPMGFHLLMALGRPIRKKMQRSGPTGIIRYIDEIKLDENRVVSGRIVK